MIDTGGVDIRCKELLCESLKLLKNLLNNNHIAANAEIEATKLQQQYKPYYVLADASTVVDVEKIIHLAESSGELVSVNVRPKTIPVGAATYTVDVQKCDDESSTWDSMLDSPQTIDSSSVGDKKVSPVIDSVNKEFTANQAIRIKIDETTGGGTQGAGVLVQLVIRESAQ